MARVLFGDIIVDMRNKSGGHVYAKNRYGNYKRTKISPVNPQTDFQQAQRQMLGSLSSAWRGLTEEQRAAWITTAASFPVTNVFGQPMILSGQALYVGLNKNLLNAGETAIADAPSPVAIPTLAIDTLVIGAGTGAKSFHINTATVPTDFALFVFATPSYGQGQSFFKNKLRFIGMFTATAEVVTITTAWNDRFGSAIVDQKVTVRAFLVSTISGQAGVPVSLTGTTAA